MFHSQAESWKIKLKVCTVINKEVNTTSNKTRFNQQHLYGKLNENFAVTLVQANLNKG